MLSTSGDGDGASLECALNVLERDEIILFDRTEIETQFIAQAGADGLLVVMFVNCNSGTSVSYKLSMIFENFDDDKTP